jgi:hypothetical protein
MTSPRHASTFTSLAERRSWLESQPDTHANYRPKNWPAAKWLISAKDTKRLDALRLWRRLNEMPQLCANDNNPTWPDGRPLVTQLNVEMETYDAEQLIYAHEHGMTRMVGNRLVKVWDGFQWRNPEEDFKTVRAANDPKIDSSHFHADVIPGEAQDEQARGIDAAILRADLGDETCAVLDMAAGDATIAEMGEIHGATSERTAARHGAEKVKTAIDCLMAATSV